MEEKTVLITGCSGGIGRATAEAFLAADWIVYATARNPADIQTLGDHENARVATLDVTEPDHVERVAQRMVDEEGRIDCLVNNAGYGQHGPLEDVPVGEVHRQFDVNVYGPHRLVRTVLPQMREQESGTIVNVSSVSGRLSVPGTGVYSGSKFALEAMSDALRGEVADFGVDVVVVEPGPVETQFQDRVETELADGDGRTLHAYGWLYDLIEDYTDVAGPGIFAADPQEVAAVIRDAACLSDPAARYPVGPGAKVMLYSRFLPDAARDRLLALLRRLTR
jgi:NAD(P)-dependent dehydrogenase (short-subunit alcohol dehydrogenase family)